MSNSTTTNAEKLHLIDGTEFSVKPLKISLLRPFMSKFAGLTDVVEDNDKSMDLLLDCVQIAFKQFYPELAEDREKLEESLDLPTVYKIIDAASGFSLSDTTALVGQMSK